MRKIIVAFGILVLLLAAVAFAAESSKPSTHDASWTKRHGTASRADDTECQSCHIDRIDCIACHEDTKPRDHTSAYVNKGHAQKARWSRQSCAPCHTDTSLCDECHEAVPPSTHTRGFGGNLYNATGDAAGETGRHCVSCHTPATTSPSAYGNDHITRGCKTCHKVLQRSTAGTHPPR
jgi:hypothetical protein